MQSIKFQVVYDDVPRYALTVAKTPPPSKKLLSKTIYGGRINSSTQDAARAAEFSDEAVASVKRYYDNPDASHEVRNLEFLEASTSEKAA